MCSRSSKRTTEIQKTTMEIEEKGVKLRLTVVDTPGFGDGLVGSDSWKVCVKYVDDQFATFFDVSSNLSLSFRAKMATFHRENLA